VTVHISSPMLENLNDLLALLEARGLYQKEVLGSLHQENREMYSRNPYYKKLISDFTKDWESKESEEVPAIPEGISPSAEALGRMRRLHALGCPRDDLEGALGFFIAIHRFPYGLVAEYVFGQGEVLSIRE